ncbi:putative LPS assembly protein LptD [Bacteroides sp.]|uniref:putative LPS assembly protein LptD n=1 Tax=Bacteroides sp. TaxID=29523 RepID=UPI001B589B45|nr:putative LPS assembly protein LptD [Bacteroides sp.]MBP6066434.1 LPS-assembly protein LptD [Bacteroides sp.]MBP6067830.1 LPS-assembly protein LptD [Bacteroides sp.]MBP6937547.1 LPS-assembly protein LptD [Bacteroides sp.]MBP8622978.1 LPS-assembly protein LptD [Bacteroides sp.]MBP9506391.1 LPS-assembly protein LptD [Bacteroides sp.]
MTPLKTNTFISFIVLFVLLMIPDEAVAQGRRSREAVANSLADTLKADTLRADTLALTPQTKKKQPLDAPVIYSANDSIVFTEGGYAHLYGDGKVNYEKIELGAQIITMNMDSSTVFARGVTDSLGVESGKPVFKDGDTPYDTKAIRYNFKSKKGYINNVVTQQGEGYVVGNNAKKGANDELFMQDGKYTTCDHHDHPHFYLQLTRAKVRPKKNVVTGPAYLVVEDVPLPLAVPFFFFPFSSSYSSGFVMPTYMDDSARGFGLANGGYYFAVSDIMDLKLTGDIFTKGSWRLGVESNYNKRYRYSGSLLADYQITKLGEKSIPGDYSVAKDFKVVWNHRQDPKASPNSTFAASVNFSTSSYERSNINNLYNSSLLTQNTKTSSISYSRSFPDQGLTLSGTTNIAQTMRDSSLSMTLPDLNITLSRLYPFKRKHGVGSERWYEKVSLSYTGRLTNTIKTKDTELFSSGLDKWETAMNHSIPIQATFTLFKFLNISPSVNYTERWYTRKVNKEYDDDRNQWVTQPGDTLRGFYRVSNYSASVSMNTKMYGIYKPLFMKKKEIQIRHVFSPQVSFNAAPGFKQYWETAIDSDGREQYYSPFDGQQFGVAPRERQGAISFDVSNNLEMKFKSKNDSIKKISLIDELGGSLSYNMAAKRQPWSDLSLRVRLKLTKSYTFNLNTSFATYAYTFDKQGNVTVGDRTEWSYGRFGRFQGYNSSFNYTFNNDSWKKWFGPKEGADKDGKDKTSGADDENADLEDDTSKPEKKVEKAKADSDGYQVFKMPWSLSFNYGFGFREDRSKSIDRTSMRYPFTFTQTLGFSGNIKISNNWTMNFTSGYTFETKEITQTSLTISRDLHCFNMSASLSPFGRWKYYNFTFRANASILQDLKWEQRSQTQSNIQWY